MEADGFARLRWGMTRHEVLEAYPAASITPTYEARHPLTGERLLVGGELLVPAIHEATAGLTVNATLAFDPADRLAEIDLWPDLEPALPGPRTITPDLVSAGVHALAGTLGVGPVDESYDEQSWTVSGVTITLTLGDGFRFEMAPTSAASRR
jgi:hypothetical protein